ncbi:MAG: hypothetical protein AVDCRST_MAG49-2472, partial [uncultured Thermomicrobiales bacterium]
EPRAVGRPGSSLVRLPVRRRLQAGHADRRPDGGQSAVRRVPSLHRRGRGAWRARAGPPRPPAHPDGPDPAGRRRTRGDHGRGSDPHAGGRHGRDGATPAGGRAPRRLRRLRPLPDRPAPGVPPPVGAPDGQL